MYADYHCGVLRKKLKGSRFEIFICEYEKINNLHGEGCFNSSRVLIPEKLAISHADLKRYLVEKRKDIYKKKKER
jgi:hypothetical protein